MILVIDNYDSFTYNLVHYIECLDQEVVVVRNDQLPSADVIAAAKGVILSPGPMLPQDAGVLLDIITLCIDKPILGICLGHQALAMHYGGKLQNNIPVHGKVTTIEVTQKTLFNELPAAFRVVRYHSWSVKKLPVELNILAKSKDGQIMAFHHKHLPHWGLQFHPESILTEFGMKILENWLLFSQIKEPKKMFD